MYLEKLFNLGVNIRELASIHLSKRYNEPKNVTFCKLSQPLNNLKKFHYLYSYIDRELDDIVNLEHQFSDFNCSNLNDLIPSKTPFDLDWIKLIHKTLLETNPELANKYMQEAIQKHKRFMTAYKNNQLMEIREARMKALEGLDIEMNGFNKTHEELIALAQICKQENNHEM